MWATSPLAFYWISLGFTWLYHVWVCFHYFIKFPITLWNNQVTSSVHCRDYKSPYFCHNGKKKKCLHSSFTRLQYYLVNPTVVSPEAVIRTGYQAKVVWTDISTAQQKTTFSLFPSSMLQNPFLLRRVLWKQFCCFWFHATQKQCLHLWLK